MRQLVMLKGVESWDFARYCSWTLLS
jgi:hypothetical protein